MSRTQAVPDRDRLSVLTAVILLAYALERFTEFPARTIILTVLGRSVQFEVNGNHMLLVLVAALIGSGSEALFRSHPALRERPGSVTVVHWILPGITALALGGLLNRSPAGLAWWIGLGLSALALMAVLVAEFWVIDPTDVRHDAAQLGLVLLSYGLILALFGLLRAVSQHALLSAAIAGIASGLIALRLLLLQGLSLTRSWNYAAVLGLSLAEMNWAAHYMRVSPVGTAMLMLIPFYVGVGLTAEVLKGGLRRGAVVEYGIVGIAGLVLAIWLSGG